MYTPGGAGKSAKNERNLSPILPHNATKNGLNHRRTTETSMKSLAFGRKNTAQQEITLLVLERGAPWPSWAERLRSRAHHSIVEVQTAGELMEQFVERCSARAHRLSERGERVVAAGYVCAAASAESPAVAPLRAELCSTLLKLLADGPDPELMVGADALESGPKQRSELLALWSQLSLARPRTTVSVLFEEDREQSGVFASARAPAVLAATVVFRGPYGPLPRADLAQAQARG